VREDEHPALPVVVLTSSGEEEDVVASLQNGANSYVRKPVDQPFRRAGQRLQAYWLMVLSPRRLP
jgi:DNA-binding response OmpR family regulator